ncbi:MAG: TraX family protein [Lachnospirales bacterium]
MNKATLKYIALIIMLIDHIGLVISPFYPILSFYMRLVGRISFPIFAFSIAEGIYYTRSRSKLMLNLFIFALISELPYIFLVKYTPSIPLGNQIFDLIGLHNVMFTFLFAVALCTFLDDILKGSFGYCVPFIFVLIIGSTSDCDYGVLGVLMVVALYLVKRQNLDINTAKNLLSLITFIFILLIYFGSIVFLLVASISIIFLYLYNGEKGGNAKFIFYIFYPLHLWILALISLFFIIN